MSDSTAIFRQACLAEVNDRIQNQVLVNRLTATSSKITKISRWEMLINYLWNWCWLSWQISRVTFTCEHVQFEWLHLLYPANEAGIPSKFSSITSPTGSPRWGHCLQQHLACEGLYTLPKSCTKPSKSPGHFLSTSMLFIECVLSPNVCCH